MFSPSNYNQYLNGGGEMGGLTRAFDWSQTLLGSPDQWSQSLLTTISIILNSKFPMFLWWGPELIQFYNDAYRPSLGENGKHPKALGQKGKECWPEIWDTIKPLIDQVMAGGESTWSEDQLIPIYRNNKLEDVYWTFGYSSVNDETGRPAGVLVICTETTEKVKAHQDLAISFQRQQALNNSLLLSNKQLIAANTALTSTNKKLVESQSQLHQALDSLSKSERRFKELMLRAPVAMAILSGPNFVIELANDKVLEYWGRNSEQVMDRPVFEALPEVKGQGLEAILQNVLTSGVPFVANERLVNVKRNGRLEKTWINFIYDPVKDAVGENTKILVACYEITKQVTARHSIEQSEEKLRQAIASAELGTWYINIETGELILSPRTIELFGFSKNARMHLKNALDQIVEEYRRTVLVAIGEARSTGNALNIEFPISGATGKKIRWLRVTGKLYQSAGNEPKHFSGTISDITERKITEAREANLFKEALEEKQKQEIFQVTIKTQEQERRRIAESLHNSIGQLLYAVKINLGDLILEPTNSEYKRFLKAKIHTEQILAEAIKEARRISHELTPNILEDFGLQAAVGDLCKQFNKTVNIRCQFIGIGTIVDKYLEVSIYRILQELILNIIKHAQATEARILVHQTSKNIEVTVADNGIGFKYEPNKTKGIGLQSILNKVKLLNGKFTIESNQGTNIYITVPVMELANG